jgi:hypothetical protein
VDRSECRSTRSTVAIGSHPVHVMLAALPITLFGRRARDSHYPQGRWRPLPNPSLGMVTGRRSYPGRAWGALRIPLTGGELVLHSRNAIYSVAAVAME